MRRRPIRNLFLLDVLQDQDSRPVFFWVVGTLAVGTISYHYLEGWSYLDSLYFSVISLTTVGYGDFTPSTPLAKLFTIVYILNGIVTLLALFDRIRTVRRQRVEDQQASQIGQGTSQNPL